MDWKDKKMKLQGLNGTLPCELLNGTLFFTLCQFLSTICKFNFFFKEDKIVFYKIGCQFKTEIFKYTSMKLKKREKIYLNS